MRIVYLAHDLDDSAIWRRAEMLRQGGAQVVLAGFRRLAVPLPGPAIVLDRTADGQMTQRAAAVLRQLPGLGGRIPDLAGADVILARNLEMLALGVRALAAAPRARLVYELLDVHRLLSGRGAVPAALRGVERLLLRRVAGVIYSSDGFRAGHPLPFRRPEARLRLVENKPLIAPEPTVPRDRGTADGSIVIGWNGILRCRWSLSVLDGLTRAAPGRWKVILRGRPALDRLPDFHQIVAANPDLAYDGPYQAPQDLAAIYGRVDLAWLIDRYEAGGNSDWLLPNRLYEGCLHGAVPVVLAGTEVARRTAALGIGICVGGADPAGVAAALTPLGADRLRILAAAVQAHPRSAWVADGAECRELVGWLGRLPAIGAKVPPSGAEVRA